MKKFTSDFIIDYRLLNSDLTASFPALMAYVQETSMLHTKQAGYDLEWFYDNKKGWVITNWDIRFYGYPHWSEKIRIETWPSVFKGFIAERSFEVFLQSGRRILSANSVWLLADMETRKPSHLSKEMHEHYGELFPSAHERNFHMPEPDIEQAILNGKFILISETDIVVERRDIDTNNHVNNVKYLEWAYNMLPEEYCYTMKLVELKAVYKKECLFRDNIKLMLYKDMGSNESLVFRIKRAGGTEIILADIYMKWSAKG